MNATNDRFLFSSAPDSWGVLDYPGPSWEQSYEKMLDEMADAGYAGTELGPYGFFPPDAEILRAQLAKRKLQLVGSFVPVRMGDFAAGKEVLERIRKVGKLLADLHARCSDADEMLRELLRMKGLEKRAKELMAWKRSRQQKAIGQLPLAAE